MNSNAATLRKIAFKLGCLLVVLVVLDVVYRFTLYPHEVKENCSLYERATMPNRLKADMVYLGESSNHSYSQQDTDRRSISSMIANAFPDHTMANLSKDACHAGVYYDILHKIPRNSTVKTVIVTVNLRSFSTEWIYSNLETALNKERVFMTKSPALYQRMLLAFKGYPHWDEQERMQLVQENLKCQTWPDAYSYTYQTADEWDHAVGNTGVLYDGTTPSLDTVILACHYIKCFACGINDQNVRVKDLDKIVKLCKKRNWKLILHILPDNIEQIEALVGPELPTIMRNNAEYLMRRYQQPGVTIINNQDIVCDSDFRDRDFPTEHYCQRGRRAVAESIIQVLQKEYAR